MLADRVWKEHPSIKFHEKLKSELLSWENTPYSEGSSLKQRGVDCVNFVCKVLDYCFGIKAPDHEKILSDVALHNPELARKCMRAIMKRYSPYHEVKDNTLMPGDIIVTRLEKSGPVHALIVGFEKNTIWHIPSFNRKVCKTGLVIPGLILEEILRRE